MNYIFILFVSFLSCNTEVPTQFTEAVLNDTFKTIDGTDIQFKEILKKHQGKQIIIDVWASWCKDCIVGMPKIKDLQKEYSDAVFVFLSLDRSDVAWKKGIKKYDVIGEHYFMASGWDGPFGEFVDLDWIPRYMVIGKEGNIELFRAIKADDKKIKDILNN